MKGKAKCHFKILFQFGCKQYT